MIRYKLPKVKFSIIMINKMLIRQNINWSRILLQNTSHSFGVSWLIPMILNTTVAD